MTDQKPDLAALAEFVESTLLDAFPPLTPQGEALAKQAAEALREQDDKINELQVKLDRLRKRFKITQNSGYLPWTVAVQISGFAPQHLGYFNTETEARAAIEGGEKQGHL